MSESKSGSKAEFLDTAFGYDATAFQAWKAKKPWLAEYARGQHRWASFTFFLILHVCVRVWHSQPAVLSSGARVGRGSDEDGTCLPSVWVFTLCMTLPLRVFPGMRSSCMHIRE